MRWSAKDARVFCSQLRPRKLVIQDTGGSAQYPAGAAACCLPAVALYIPGLVSVPFEPFGDTIFAACNSNTTLFWAYRDLRQPLGKRRNMPPCDAQHSMPLFVVRLGGTSRSNDARGSTRLAWA